MILDETIYLIKAKYISQIEKLTIADVRIGVHLTAVQLSDNSYGVAGTVPDDRPFCAKKDRDFGNFTPSKITGQKVLNLLEASKQTAVVNSLKIATLNALSSKFLSTTNYKVLEDTDPIDLIELTLKRTITVIGAFQSYIQKIAATTNRLFVLELNEKSLEDAHKQYYVPASEYASVLPISDVVIITGLTLVNNAIDGILTSIVPDTQVAITGPSSCLFPDTLFQNKVNIIGATRITQPEKLFSIVSEGGAGYHLFKYCAQKICIIHE